MKKIQTIVEGHGEVAAFPVLLWRLINEAQISGIFIDEPIRRTQSQFRQEKEIQKAVKLAKYRKKCDAIIILFDGEDDCPVKIAKDVKNWAQAVTGTTPCEVVVAYREYETWFLAAVESLRGKHGISKKASSPSHPEAKRGAKEALEEFMPQSNAYSETEHQKEMSRFFDMASAYRKNRSFRKLVKSFGDIANALGNPISVWPPQQWQ